jgi:spermidine synthase
MDILRAAMTSQNPEQSRSSARRAFLPFLLLLFFGSGCAALIYEIVWFQMLQFIIGSSAVSLGVLLGVYMGGMCLGSVALSRVISASRHPLRVYALLELGIGLAGIVILYGLPRAAWIYSAHVGTGFSAILLRGLFAALCLLPPTVLMGATLPAISRWIEATPRGVAWLGFFYGGNIAGAVFGCLLAGFYLLRVHDSAFATFVAAAINGAVALAAFVLAGFAPYENRQLASGQERELPFSDSTLKDQRSDGAGAKVQFVLPHFAIALSGLTALGAEVVWTRLLSLLLGGTVYAFAIILAVFLFGLGIGSAVGSMVARRMARPALALAWCQFFLTGAIAWTACMLAESLPYWPINVWLSPSIWINYQLDLARCLWALLPATLLWGASFPLALAAAAAAARGRDPARLVGGVYAANTIGGIIGGLAFSLIFIPKSGTRDSQGILILFAMVSALLMFAPYLEMWRKRFSGMLVLRDLGMAAVLIIGPLYLAGHVGTIPWELIAYGRAMPTRIGEADKLYVGEGMNSSVAVSQTYGTGDRNFHVSGKIEASSQPADMRMQRMLGHLPGLVHPGARSVLIVGCGAGVTTGTFTVYPEIEKITLCELEPLVPQLAAKYFPLENNNVLHDPRTRVVFDDGRHFILTTHEKFDIVTSDPIHPWVKGSATLYTKEYFELVKQHLNPGGIVTQWVPLYESDEDVVKSEIATFFAAFPHGTIWSNDEQGKGYDVVLLGQVEDTKIDLDALDRRCAQPNYAGVVKSLQFVGFPAAFDMYATYAGQACDLAPWLEDAQINHDSNLRLQYLAGLGLNKDLSASIYDNMLRYSTFPERLFSGSETNLEAMRIALSRQKKP